MTRQRSFLYRCILVLLFQVNSCIGQEGWKMTDRFYGFRYELVVKDRTNSHLTEVADNIQSHADQLGCFGWVQQKHSSTDGRLVGEVRCSKGRGKSFEDWLKQDLEGIEHAETLVYSDTKIRLHFSHFKVLDPSRETCFLDKPHQCPDLAAGSSTSKSSSTDNNILDGSTSARINEL